MTLPKEIAVVGTGIVGLSVADELARARASVAVIDLAPFPANRFAIQGDPRLNDPPYVFLH